MRRRRQREQQPLVSLKGKIEGVYVNEARGLRLEIPPGNVLQV